MGLQPTSNTLAKGKSGDRKYIPWLFCFLIEVYSVYDAVFTPGGQHSDSVIHTHTLLFIVFFIIGCYKVLETVLFAIELHVFSSIAFDVPPSVTS